MTKIWLISDLHEETASFDLPPVPDGVEVLVIAGDISENWGWSLNMCVRWQLRCGLPVIFVPGNHDYYRADLGVFDAQADVWERAAALGLHVLHGGQSVVIAGSRFIGATLWTDFAIAGDVLKAGFWFHHNMPDHNAIDLGMRRVRARDLRHEHKRQLAAIEAVLAQPFEGPTVVVTHHAPHRLSLSDPELIDESDASFASDLTSTIMRHRPHMWLHGHVHHSADYIVGDTYVVCNPRGYVTPEGPENRSFNSEFVIHV